MKIIRYSFKCPLLKFAATKCTDTYIIYLVMYLYNIVNITILQDTNPYSFLTMTYQRLLK